MDSRLDKIYCDAWCTALAAGQGLDAAVAAAQEAVRPLRGGQRWLRVLKLQVACDLRAEGLDEEVAQ